MPKEQENSGSSNNNTVYAIAEQIRGMEEEAGIKEVKSVIKEIKETKENKEENKDE